MSEKKHIDRLFQEKFKDFEAAPKEAVWKNIEQQLTEKKSRKPVMLPLWQKISGVAALLAIVFLVGDFVFDDAEKKIVGSEKNTKENVLEKGNETEIPSDNNFNNGIETQNAIANESTEPEIEIKDSVSNSQTRDKNPAISNSANSISTHIRKTNGGAEIVSTKTQSEQQQLVSENRNEKNTSAKNTSKVSRQKNTGFAAAENNAKVPSSSENHVSVSEKTNVNPPKKEGTFASLKPENTPKNELEKTKNSSANENKKSLIEVAAAQNQSEKQPKNYLKTDLAETSKWQVKPFAAPVFYGGFGSENALDATLAENNSEGEITFSYGVNFSYKISERLKIRSGVGQVSMAYNVHDIAVVPAIKPTALANVSHSTEASQIEIISTANFSNSNQEIFGRNPFTEGTLHQQLGFIEIPLEIEYALLDKKFGVSIIGGASTLFLNENTLAVQSENGTTNIGEMNNLNNTSFSTNIGLGLDYKISKQFEINLEPVFKYQINTFGKNANGFQPYYFGVYTGLGFKF